MSQDKVHLMVDIESEDVEPSAVILSIGGCTIREIDTSKYFYSELDTNTQFGRTKSPFTLEWWKTQVAKGGYKPDGKVYIKDALEQFSDWIKSFNARPIIWCKGTDFDVKILDDAYKMEKLEVPWAYNDVRDFRTLKKLHPQLTFPENQFAHHALEDALYQARCLNTIFAYNDRLQWE